MYRQYEDRKVCMYNIYGTNQSTHIFNTKWFSQLLQFKIHRKTFPKSAPLEDLNIKSLFMRLTLPYQIHKLVYYTCLSRILLSMYITGYISYVRINDHSSANTNKTHNLITTSKRKETKNIATQGNLRMIERTNIRSCLL